MTYKEIIDKNIEEFDEKFECDCENPDRICHMGLDCTVRTHRGAVKCWHTQSLISYLEEENKRLEEKNKWTQSDLKSPFGHSEDKGYNECLNEQVEHNKNVIAYIKGL